MTLKSVKSAAMSLALVIALGACASAPAQRPGRVYVRVAPPPARVEVVTVRPGPNYAWVAGRYSWDGRAYAWVPGNWVRVRPGARRYVPGHWAHERQGWYWVDGRWR